MGVGLPRRGAEPEGPRRDARRGARAAGQALERRAGAPRRNALPLRRRVRRRGARSDPDTLPAATAAAAAHTGLGGRRLAEQTALPPGGALGRRRAARARRTVQPGG